MEVSECPTAHVTKTTTTTSITHIHLQPRFLVASHSTNTTGSPLRLGVRAGYPPFIYRYYSRHQNILFCALHPHTIKHVHIHTHASVCMYKWLREPLYTLTHVHVHTRTLVHLTGTHIHKHACAYVHVYSYTGTHAHGYTCPHAHKYTWPPVPKGQRIHARMFPAAHVFM